MIQGREDRGSHSMGAVGLGRRGQIPGVLRRQGQQVRIGCEKEESRATARLWAEPLEGWT